MCDARPRINGGRVLTRAAPPQRDEVTKLFTEAVAKYGKVDILVNNAGARAQAHCHAGPC